MKRRLPTVALALDDALAAPVAPAAMQPSPDAVAASPASGLKLKLAAGIPRGRLLLNTIMWIVVLAPFGFVGVMVYASGFADTERILGDGFQVAMYIVSALLLVLFAWAMAVDRNHSRVPPVTADDSGLRGKALGATTRQGANTPLPWRAIRAWAVLPAADPSQPSTYLVFGDDARLMWRELPGSRLAGRGVVGDRRAAYAERATQLHALIVARTGLPLCLIQPTSTKPAV